MKQYKAWELLPEEKVYLKSEADKVIADLEENHKKEVGQLLILNREQANPANRLRDSMEQVIHHQKYKRCLAMARWCEAEMHRSLTEQSALIDFPEIDRFQYLQWNFMHFKKWHKRWLELAKKFKEANDGLGAFR